MVGRRLPGPGFLVGALRPPIVNNPGFTSLVSRRKNKLYSGTDPESYIPECCFGYEDYVISVALGALGAGEAYLVGKGN